MQDETGTTLTHSDHDSPGGESTLKAAMTVKTIDPIGVWVSTS